LQHWQRLPSPGTRLGDHLGKSQYNHDMQEFSQFGLAKKEPCSNNEVTNLPQAFYIQMVLRALAEGMISGVCRQSVDTWSPQTGVGGHRVPSRELMRLRAPSELTFLAHRG